MPSHVNHTCVARAPQHLQQYRFAGRLYNPAARSHKLGVVVWNTLLHSIQSQGASRHCTWSQPLAALNVNRAAPHPTKLWATHLYDLWAALCCTVGALHGVQHQCAPPQPTSSLPRRMRGEPVVGEARIRGAMRQAVLEEADPDTSDVRQLPVQLRKLRTHLRMHTSQDTGLAYLQA